MIRQSQNPIYFDIELGGWYCQSVALRLRANVMFDTKSQLPFQQTSQEWLAILSFLVIRRDAKMVASDEMRLRPLNPGDERQGGDGFRHNVQPVHVAVRTALLLDPCGCA